MDAPEKFAQWMSQNIANDKKFGRKVFRYHPRSNAHSKVLCQLILEDLLNACPELARHAKERSVVAGIDCDYTFPNGKTKNLDLAIGTPLATVQPELFESDDPILMVNEIESLRIACEAKQAMTEHSKAKPRSYDELSSSHEIVHQGDTNAIAAGIIVVNIADEFASPLRQKSKRGKLVITKHRQPMVTEAMVKHFGGLTVRDTVGEVGFDAFACVVINCDNLGPCTLHTDSPAPQPDEQHHYATFIKRIADAYASRFGGE